MQVWFRKLLLIMSHRCLIPYITLKLKQENTIAILAWLLILGRNCSIIQLIPNEIGLASTSILRMKTEK